MSAQAKKNRKISCVHCRKLKRKCDGELPCLNCQKRNIVCEYSSTDRRSQRFSLVYIKSLETNAEIYEDILNELVLLRGDKDALAAKVGSLKSSIPVLSRPTPLELLLEEMASIQLNEVSAENERAHLDDEENYYGPGSIYHFGEYTTPQLLKSLPLEHTINTLETVQTNYDFIKSVVVNFFTHQWPLLNSYYLDKTAILTDLRKGNLYESSSISEELLYAICANSELLSYEAADAYKLLALSKVYPTEIKLLVPLAQAYMLLAAHEFSLGKVTSGWQLSGSAMRMGFDLGFHHHNDPNISPIKNRLFFGFMLIDSYICMAVGRPNTLTQNSLPVQRLPDEDDSTFYNLRDAVLLLELTRPMHKATYEPILFNKDPRINYLLKFNRSKMFNVKILKWKSDLDPESHWLYALLKALDDLAFQNHNLKFIYWYVLLFINKPFLHVPKQYSAGYIIEEMSKEVYLIVCLRLERMEREARAQQLYPLESFKFVRYDQSDPYHWATLDICMITLLSHVVVTLIMDHPNDYLYMEKHLKAFSRYLNGVSARKYKCKHNAMERLLERYKQWRASRPDLPPTKLASHESAYEMRQLKESIDETSPQSLLTGSDHVETPGSNYNLTSGSETYLPFDKKMKSEIPETNHNPPPPFQAPPYQQQPPLQMMERVQFDDSQMGPPMYPPPPQSFGSFGIPQGPNGAPYYHPQFPSGPQGPPQGLSQGPPQGPPPPVSHFAGPPNQGQPPPQMNPVVYGNVPPHMPEVHSTPHSTYNIPHSVSTVSGEPSLVSVPLFSETITEKATPDAQRSRHYSGHDSVAPSSAFGLNGDLPQGNMQQNIDFYEAMTQPLPNTHGFNEFQTESAPAGDDVGQMMDTLFSNTGEEFEAPTEQFNWDKLFNEKYALG